MESTKIQLTDNARTVLEARYLKKDKNGNIIEQPEDLFYRVASTIASAEANYVSKEEKEATVKKYTKLFYDMMANLYFLPNSPTLMNAGRRLGQLAACFVLPVEDDLESIFNTLKHAALIHKSGGGTGFDFSRLRPKGSVVGSTNGVASGSVSFMKIFNASTEQIKQGGTRRGANMGILRVDHPDILEFITCKDSNNQELNNFNISVAVTNEFMEAVINDREYQLIDPKTKKPVKTLSAKYVFDLIVKRAWETGDPGMIFIDNINKDNPTPELGPIESTNPCVSADTWVMTSNGPKQVKDLIDKKVEIKILGYDIPTKGFFKTGTKQLLKIITEEGIELRLTPDHLVLTENFIWKKAEELTKGTKLILNTNIFEKRTLCKWPGKYTYDDGKAVAHAMLNLIPHFIIPRSRLESILSDLGLKENVLNITDKMESETSSDFYKGFLSVAAANAKHLCNLSDKDNVMLRLNRMQLHLGMFPYGKKYVIVDKVIKDKTENVYDIKVPDLQAFGANGIVVHNCGEQPLLPYEACNLGSINLAKFVIMNEAGQPQIDYEKLANIVHLAVRFLDDVIDVSKYPLPQITKMVKANRKIGLGVMGFADMLVQLKIRYGSPESIQVAEEVMKFIQIEAKKASLLLGKEKGTFPNYDKSIYKNNPNATYRNATVTTIAPTGTLSIIAGCSSGIEPLFGLCFQRHVLDDETLTDINPYFQKELKSIGLSESQIQSIVTKVIKNHGSVQNVPDVPEKIKQIFVTAHDIPPEEHIAIQAAFQKYTDNAVSKTINLKNSATVDDVKNAYLLAYEYGLKGITIYRDGSKSVQVITTSDSKEDIKQPQRRPDTLSGFTTKVKTGMGNLYITINEHNGKPFEVFAIIGKSGKSTTAKTEAIGRLVSLCLRSGITIEEIVRQLKGIGGEYPVFQNKQLILSIPDAIAKILEQRYLNNTITNNTQQLHKPICPNCGNELVYEEGCSKCYSCGYSTCG